MSESEAWVEALLKKRERERSVIRVLSTSQTPLFNGRRENYLSEVTKLKFRMVRGDGETVTDSFVVKILPRGSFMSLLVLNSGANFIEFTMYRDVLPAMKNVMKNKGLTEEPLWPKCYALEPYDKIALEDLSARGFKMADRITGLNFEHCALVMQSLGHYHALSLALKDSVVAKKAFDRCFTERNSEHRSSIIDKPFQQLLQIVDGWGHEWANVLARLKEKAEVYCDGIIEAYKSNGFEVLAHCDPWTNNLLFKYDVYTGKSIQMKLLDYQCSTLSTPAADLGFFLTISPDLETRSRSQELIVLYYNSLILNMDRLGLVSSPRPTLQFIKDEFKRVIDLRIRAMLFLQVILVKEKNVGNLCENTLSESWKEKFEDYIVQILQMILKEAFQEGSL